jgi:hypothetical protein
MFYHVKIQVNRLFGLVSYVVKQFLMLVKEFYKIFLIEESTVKYLQDYGLPPSCVKQCYK